MAIAAELTGIGQRAMEMAVEYARERKQFGRPIGAYQAVSHRCAAMLLGVEESRSLTYYAAWAADAEPESLPMAAAMAGARAADAAWETTASALQVFGGIGFTWEHDLQFWLKRVPRRRPHARHPRASTASGSPSWPASGAAEPARSPRTPTPARAGSRRRRSPRSLPPQAEVDVDGVVARRSCRTARAPSPASAPPLTCSFISGRVKRISRPRTRVVGALASARCR